MSLSKQKIGILTFHKSPSYGAVLQCFALFSALKNMGRAEVGVIDFTPPRMTRFTKGGKRNVFQEFSNRRLNMLTNGSDDLLKCLSSLKDDSQPVTDIVVGSDQVWNAAIVKESLIDYCLGRELPGVRKHAYAASFGTSSLNVNEDILQIYSRALADYRSIGVREKSAVGICQSLGRNDIVNVIDPTLLVDPEIYTPMIDRNFVPNRLCGYFLENAGYQAKIMKKIARKQKTSPLFLGIKAPFFSFVKSIHAPEVEGFLSAIHNSSGVVTDSFHGMCFAIIFKRPFIVLPSQRKERFVRLAELLERFGLQDRIIADYDTNKAVSKLLEPIDYSRVDEIIRQYRGESLEFINRIFDK